MVRIFVIVIVGCLIGLALIVLVNTSDALRIQTLRVYGDLLEVDSSQIRSVLLKNTQNNFFSYNINRLKNKLQVIPEIERAEVKRLWPHRVDVTVMTQTAVARWNKSDQFINAYGEIFHSDLPLFHDMVLPLFVGEDQFAIKMLDYYQQMNTILLPLNLTVEKLLLDGMMSWCVQLDNGMNVQLGQRDVFAKLKRFVSIYPKVFHAQKAKVASTVDLRYVQGMAVAWSAQQHTKV